MTEIEGKTFATLKNTSAKSSRPFVNNFKQSFSVCRVTFLTEFYSIREHNFTAEGDFSPHYTNFVSFPGKNKMQVVSVQGL